MAHYHLNLLLSRNQTQIQLPFRAPLMHITQHYTERSRYRIVVSGLPQSTHTHIDQICTRWKMLATSVSKSFSLIES